MNRARTKTGAEKVMSFSLHSSTENFGGGRRSGSNGSNSSSSWRFSEKSLIGEMLRNVSASPRRGSAGRIRSEPQPGRGARGAPSSCRTNNVHETRDESPRITLHRVFDVATAGMDDVIVGAASNRTRRVLPEEEQRRLTRTATSKSSQAEHATSTRLGALSNESGNFDRPNVTTTALICELR